MSIEIRQTVIDVTVNVRQDGLAISLQPVIVRAGVGGAVWGSITGEIIDQTDLIEYLETLTLNGGTP